ncbi:probable glucuronoxylan glucuronosyltransferase F8H isoform X2 [Typha latifolia]|uniref:probable glucuronoxylan glucuronosyltransferase F8H isoform X2 n=1 Tax=Typha latifolia TaxID=4733 RepID=UPI003C2EE9FB
MRSRSPFSFSGGGVGGYHHPPPCTRAHQIGALALVAVTFLITRSLDRFLLPHSSPPFLSSSSSSSYSMLFDSSSSLTWPSRGYGSRLDLKIYVYDDAEIDGLRELMRGRDGRISPESCIKGQWGTQVKIHRLLLKSRFRTLHKDEADLFFVPSYVKCVRMMGGLNDKEINQTYVKVLSQMPYFRYSGGRDHIFVFPSGAGAHLFRSWAVFLNRSIILTPEGDRTDKRDTSAFNTWKDIVIPGNVDDGMTKFHGSRIVQPIPLSNRKYLANYLGRAQGKVGRLQLVELAKQYPDKECVPVILSDKAELPFQNVVDYTQISIKWPSTRINTQLLEYLESIPDEMIEGMIARGREVRCLWVYAPETEPCSAMVGILWELQRKVRQFHQSAETFWLHNRSIVNRDLIEFHNWRTPVPLP